MSKRIVSLGLALGAICFAGFMCGEDGPISGNPALSNPNNTNTQYGIGADYIPSLVGSDTIGRSAFEDGSAARLAQYGVPQYFWGDMGTGQQIPLVKITHAVTSQTVDMDLTFNPAFNDLTYGTSSFGWNPKRPHTFEDLHKSDHVELAVINGAGDTVFYGRLDLISPTTKVTSGYACLGPFGGDGTISKGDTSKILSFGSSLDDNINYYGYELFQDSPPPDSIYGTNAPYPYWQNYVSFRLTLDASVFGSSGYGKILMTSVHASPSKGLSTVAVSEQPGPIPGSTEDPFRFYIPTKPSVPDTTTPPDTATPPDTTTPPDTVPVDTSIVD